MSDVVIHDVGLRDGLQMEKSLVPLETKIEWAKKLVSAGIEMIQLGSFVNPEKMPQMAQIEDLFAYFNNNSEPNFITKFTGLVLNEMGYTRASRAGVEMICMGVSASETHSMKNTGMSVFEATATIVRIAKEALKEGKQVQASVQSAFGCGYIGSISEDKVFQIVEKYISAGVKIISLADTAGHANPRQVERMFGQIRKMDSTIELACHFHNTYGMGLANCYTAINSGVKYIETAFGGLGGCPFTKLPSGNVCTEDLVHMLQTMGMSKNIDLLELIEISKSVSQYFQKDMPGMLYKSGPIKHKFQS